MDLMELSGAVNSCLEMRANMSVLAVLHRLYMLAEILPLRRAGGLPTP